MVSLGDVCVTQIPLSILIDSFQENDNYKMYICSFSVATGETIKISILIEQGEFVVRNTKRGEDLTFFWSIYASQIDIETVDEIAKVECRIALYNNETLQFASVYEN